MDAYSLSIKRSATKDIQAIARQDALSSLIEKIRSLARHLRTPGPEQLAGKSGHYRVRQGDYRIIDSVDDQDRRVDVIKAVLRRDVHR